MSFDGNIAPLVDEYGAIDEQIKALSKRKDQLDKQVKEALAEQFGSGQEKATLRGELYVIEASMRAGSKTFPADSVKAAEEALGVDLSPFAKQNAPSMTKKVVRL